MSAGSFRHGLAGELQRAIGHPYRSPARLWLRGLGPRKAAELWRKLVGDDDRILIEPSTLPEGMGGVGQCGYLPRVTDRYLRPDWRCGHFRPIRNGEGLAESRLGWLQPILVNAAELTGAGAADVKTKPYVVR